LKVVLGQFARSSLEERFGPDLSGSAREAVGRYARRLDSGVEPLPLPPFSTGPGSGEAAGAEFELAVVPEVEAALETEALEQAVPLERIVSHAVLVYLADLDAPAVAPRVAALS
jgi:hypothetical protein